MSGQLNVSKSAVILLRFLSLIVSGAVLIFGVALLSYGKVGDTASGAVASESDTVLVLRTNPCDPNSAILTFTYPWRKRSVGTKKCSDKTSYDLFEVEQLPPDKKPPTDGDAKSGGNKDHSQDQPPTEPKKSRDPAKDDNSSKPPIRGK